MNNGFWFLVNSIFIVLLLRCGCAAKTESIPLNPLPTPSPTHDLTQEECDKIWDLYKDQCE